ncbi:MAG TPA: cobalamin biosynthesis protein, partial [Acidimicrobiales bacterium]
MTGVLCCSITARGAELARRLPYPHHERPGGGLVAAVRGAWGEVEALVLICAAGIAVRAVAPLLGSKAEDPAVVVVDDQGRWAVPLVGGHARGANALAREIASLLGAEAVVTTAADGAGLVALDQLPGFTASGDVAGVTRRWLDGHAPCLAMDLDLRAWPLPTSVTFSPQHDDSRVLVTDRDVPAAAGEVVLRPRSLVVGVGASTGAGPAGMCELVLGALAAAGLHPAAVGAVATLDRKAAEPAVVELAAALGVEVRPFAAEVLAAVDTPTPSEVVRDAVGTPSVAEAAALAAAGLGSALVVAKQKAADATVAVARRARPEGSLHVVGLGPGDPALRTAAAAAVVRHAEVVVGYGPYVDLAADLLSEGQDVLRFPIGEERPRCAVALQQASEGRAVALVCSGDPGVYAMAGLVLEMAGQHGLPPVSVVPGVTAALAAAAVLGAPLGHDHASVSLSDLLTPWD